MNISRTQRGAGLIEVMVAVLLLGVGVLGFSMLQVKAVGATAESDQRAEAVMLVKDLVNRINIATLDVTPNESKAIMTSYASAINGAPTESGACIGETAQCQSSQLISADSYEFVQSATNKGMVVSIQPCKSVRQDTSCAIVAWGKTSATYGAGGYSCFDDTTSAYVVSSTCVLMELM